MPQQCLKLRTKIEFHLILIDIEPEKLIENGTPLCPILICPSCGGKIRIFAFIKDHKIMEICPRIKLFC